MNGLAVLYSSEGDLDRAEALYEEVLMLDRERGDPDGIALGFVNLGVVSIQRGVGERAAELLYEALAITEKEGLKRTGLMVLFNSIGLAALRSEWERAARFYGCTEALRERTGLHREPSDDKFLMVWLERIRAALPALAFQAAEAAGRALGYEEAVGEARGWLEGLRGFAAR